jgi:serine/threonine kinase PknH
LSDWGLVEGTPFGRYRLLSLLGRGGMGEVWRAFDTDTNRVVAVKVLPTNLASDPQFEQRFRREANAAAGLNDPHVVPIHHFGEIDGRLYVDMRLIEGRDLDKVIAGGPLHPARAVGIIEDVASALDSAHRIGLAHRDVKPSNILIGERDFAYLIDFGIARAANDTGMTNTGAVIGTWAYLAPERITGEADHRADVYALACVLFECLTGSQPFPGASIEKIVGGHLGLPPPRPSALLATVPAQFDEVIARGMAKNPEHRYPSATALAVAARSALSAPMTPPWGVPDIPRPSGFAPASATIASTHYVSGLESKLPERPSYPARRPKAKARGWLIAAGVVVVAVVAGLVFVVAGRDDGAAPTAASTSSTTTAPPLPPDPGPFTGTFTAAFGNVTSYDGRSGDGPPFTDTFRLRSACGPDGCVATAGVDGQFASKDLVFDKVGQNWLAVSISRRSCRDYADDEAWNVISLQPQPDGTMTGEMTQTTVHDCFNKRTLTFSRTGDTDTSRLSDPAALPPRTPSPANALHGRYAEVVTAADGFVWRYEYAARTDCLRTGDRCISYFGNAEQRTSETYVFANGTWTRDTTYDGACAGGGTNRIKNTATMSLPQPPQDPINQLVGHGYKDIAPSPNSRCHSQAYDLALTRVGD